MKNNFYLAILVLGALSERIWFDLGPNVELVTWATVLASMYEPRPLKYLVPLFIMIFSDLLLGLTSISFFTWTGFLCISAIPEFLKRKIQNKTIRGTSSGLIGVVIFYLWTNFGVWLIEPGNMYSNDLAGLLQSYYNALPFLKMQVTSALLFIPLTLEALELFQKRQIKVGKLWL